MKKIILILTLFTGLHMLAQPIITRENYYDAGDSLLVHYKFDISLHDFSIGESGANVTWDFSDMNFEHISVIVDTIAFKSPAGTPFYPTYMGADYSDANLCYVRKTEPDGHLNNNYNYFFADNDKLEFIGNWADNSVTEHWEDFCSDPIKELVFPMTYNDEYADPFERSYVDYTGGAHTVTGTVTVKADSYGTLIVNNETINDVIRVHRIETGTNTPSEGAPFVYNKHNYYWYSASQKGFILRFDMGIYDPTVIETADYQKQTNLGVETFIKDEIILAPNPAQSFVTLTSKSTPITDVSIYDSLGKEVAVESGSSLERINIEQLANGVYLLRIKLDNQNMQRYKLIKN